MPCVTVGPSHCLAASNLLLAADAVDDVDDETDIHKYTHTHTHKHTQRNIHKTMLIPSKFTRTQDKKSATKHINLIRSQRCI